MVYCMAPFIHSYVMSGEQTERVCCVAKPHSDTIEIDLEKRWTSDNYQKIRQEMLSDKPTEYIKNICSRCITVEASGDESDRQRFNKTYHSVSTDIVTGNQYGTPLDLDLRPSNLCNLQCRMCVSTSSSQIEKEIQKHGEILWFMGPERVSINSINDKNLTFLLSNIEYSKRIKFLGGEPTIMPEVHTILDVLIDRNAVDIPIHFTTNLTNANTTFLNKLKKFSNISFNYSIDGTEKTLEYIRHPVNWNTLEKNIKLYENMATYSSITFTLQAYNLHNLKDFSDWANSINVNMRISLVEQPAWDSIYVLPKSYRDSYLEHINTNITDYLLHVDTKYSIIDFIRNTKILDKTRNQHIKDYIPEIWELIKEDYDAIQI